MICLLKLSQYSAPTVSKVNDMLKKSTVHDKVNDSEFVCSEVEYANLRCLESRSKCFKQDEQNIFSKTLKASRVSCHN